MPLNPFGVAPVIYLRMDKGGVVFDCVVNGERKLLREQPVNVPVRFEVNAGEVFESFDIQIDIFEEIITQPGSLPFIE
jgi:hypothetical protein